VTLDPFEHLFIEVLTKFHYDCGYDKWLISRDDFVDCYKKIKEKRDASKDL
jgi:hypothetical protein